MIDVNRPVRIDDLGPLLALQRGYLEGAAELLAADSPLRDNILELTHEFDELTERFEAGTKERLYLLEIRMISSALAQGMIHRSRVRADRLAAARQEREIAMRRVVQTQTLAGMARGGLQLLLVGGFAYAVVSTFFSLPRIAAKTEGVNENFASIATAAGSALIGSFFKAWWMGYRAHQVTRTYEHEVATINRDYALSMRKEYKLAADEANFAWRKLTGRDPEVTAAFQELLMDVMAGEHRAASPEGEEDVVPPAFGPLSALMASLRGRFGKSSRDDA